MLVGGLQQLFQLSVNPLRNINNLFERLDIPSAPSETVVQARATNASTQVAGHGGPRRLPKGADSRIPRRIGPAVPPELLPAMKVWVPQLDDPSPMTHGRRTRFEPDVLFLRRRRRRSCSSSSFVVGVVVRCRRVGAAVFRREADPQLFVGDASMYVERCVA